MLEAIKNFGSFVGLVTGIFYFYDRFAKGRPVASLTITMEGDRKSVRLRIGNPSSYDIAIMDITVHPAIYALAEGAEIKDTLRASFGNRPSFMMKPSSEKEVRLVAQFKDNLPLELQPRTLAFLIWWRRGNATWLPQIPVAIITSTSTIRKFGLEQTD